MKDDRRSDPALGSRLHTTRCCAGDGSNPHLVHEMISALAEDRDPYPNAPTSANWTSVGILAHESALAGGEIIRLPEFTS